MRWIRGGQWEAVALPGLIAVEFRPPSRQPRAERPYNLHVEDDMWWASIGEPLGLEEYELDDASAEVMVGELEALPSDLFVGQIAWEARMGICAWLSRWGPPTPMVGVTPPSMAVDMFKAPRALGSHDLALEFGRLVSGKRALDRLVARTASIDDVAAGLLASAHRPLQDCEVFPVIKPEGVVYDARPRSLRSYLWQWLLWRCGRVPRQLCRYCAEPFVSPPGPGKPPAYCPAHRDSKFRHRVRKNQAPSMRIPSEFDEED